MDGNGWFITFRVSTCWRQVPALIHRCNYEVNDDFTVHWRWNNDPICVQIGSLNLAFTTQFCWSQNTKSSRKMRTDWWSNLSGSPASFISAFLHYRLIEWRNSQFCHVPFIALLWGKWKFDFSPPQTTSPFGNPEGEMLTVIIVEKNSSI